MSTGEKVLHITPIFKRYLRRRPFLKQPVTAIFDRNDNSQSVLIQLQENVHPQENWEYKDKTTNALKGEKKGTAGKEMKIVISDKLSERKK